ASPSDNPAPLLVHCLSLHDALPICTTRSPFCQCSRTRALSASRRASSSRREPPSFRTTVLTVRTGDLRSRSVERTSTMRHLSPRSEEHTSELQSRENLVCRLLLEKK